ncbi:multidrug/biocide efflux PACE transporter [Chitinibacter fontanus]|uniref:Multidrug/biocide efflux PACE transporter n=1 Tax=Chitinibacter fontanus TaxID=1737446 RepID=A0A7D5V8N5_9NEIS|nr:multidrug/biocide efflux PACE transporter [Chitinibacter fontanus]QLI80754.1 multidrug/biocide efflux PACE transporter [Chitinibacter fontanus]
MPDLAQLPAKTWAERVLHAVLFEVGGVLLVTPIAAWLLGASVAHVGVLAVILASCAMLWNAIFNYGFEKLERRQGWQRTAKIRTLHALLFEGGFIMLAVPLTMWWLQLSLWQALALDIGFFLFFLPYTYLYNWAYDVLRLQYFRRQRPA